MKIIKLIKKIGNLSFGGVSALIIILTLIAFFGLSWILTCGIIKLITICFGWTFEWGISTGIWLIICLLVSTVKPNKNKG